MPNPNVWVLLESDATPGNFASVPAAAGEAAGVPGAGTEGGMALGAAPSLLWAGQQGTRCAGSLLHALLLQRR